jgi:hypothetical protein
MLKPQVYGNVDKGYTNCKLIHVQMPELRNDAKRL